MTAPSDNPVGAVATHAEDAHAFVQEVRRLAPFVPLLTMTLRAVASREEWTSVAGAHDRTRIPARPDVWLRR